jgi:hypothetical protein
MYFMHNGTLKRFFLAQTAHRSSKLVTLGVVTSLLIAMVNIDASASTTFVGPNANTVSTAMLMKLANETGNRTFSGVRRHWPKPTVTTTTTFASIGFLPPTTSTTTTTSPTSPTSSTTTTTTAPPTTTTTSAPSDPAATGGPITAGPSRSECLALNTTPDVYGLASLQTLITSFDQETKSTVTCILSYSSDSPTWAAWEDPWMLQSGFGYNTWVDQEPQTRQLVLGMDLIPATLEDVNNPLSWEQSCAAGDFNAYATQLGENLVSAGLGNSVIRLGVEMNGSWEIDFMGNTAQEQNLWAQCFANEVTGFRQAPGEHLLFDWNPNACTQSVPYSNFYPGNAYVDILGLDFYDRGCDAPSTALTFAQLSAEPYGLNSFETFAAAQNKPMSFPEWGLLPNPSGDDPAYIDGIGSTVANNDFAFEAYFDSEIQTGVLALSSSTPLSLAAFQHWFGNS